MNTLLAAAPGGIPLLAVLAAVGPLVAAVVALVMLGPQRARLVGESLGDAVEDLRNELREVRTDRDAARSDLADVRHELAVVRDQLAAALARISELEGNPT